MHARPTHARTLGVRGLSLRLSLAASRGKERVRLEVGAEEEEKEKEKEKEQEDKSLRTQGRICAYTPLAAPRGRERVLLEVGVGEEERRRRCAWGGLVGVGLAGEVRLLKSLLGVWVGGWVPESETNA